MDLSKTKRKPVRRWNAVYFPSLGWPGAIAIDLLQVCYLPHKNITENLAPHEWGPIHHVTRLQVSDATVGPYTELQQRGRVPDPGKGWSHGRVRGWRSQWASGPRTGSYGRGRCDGDTRTSAVGAWASAPTGGWGRPSTSGSACDWRNGATAQASPKEKTKPPNLLSLSP